MRTEKHDDVRFTEGKGWLQGTQAFLQIGTRDTGTSGGGDSGSSAAEAVAPSSGVAKGRAEKGEDVAQVLITVSEGTARRRRDGEP